jgi:hypothetical protein
MKIPKSAHIAFHVIAYYSVWFICIVTAAHGSNWSGFVISSFIIGMQLIWQFLWRRETKNLVFLLVLMLVFGGLIDSIFMWFKLIDFKANPFAPYFAPAWMLALWAEFALVFYSLLQILWTRYWLLSLLSLIGFPAAYFAGVKLGAATLSHTWLFYLLLGLVWALVFPIIIAIFNARRKHV